MKTLNRNKIIFVSCAAFVLAALLGVSLTSVRVRNVLGLQSVGSVACFTGDSIATTSYSFMSRGAGTTTLTCLTQKTDTLTVNVQLAASSTASRYRYRKECSNNNGQTPGGDWYANVGQLNENATTTNETPNFSEFSLRYASSTNGIPGGTSQDIGFAGRGTTTANFLNLDVSACSQDYTRLVFYLDNDNVGGLSTTTNGAIKAFGVVKEEVTR